MKGKGFALAGLLAATAIVVIVALFLFQKKAQAPTATPTATQTVVIPTATPDQTAGWKTFRDPFGKFTVKYPPGWFVYPSESESSSSILTNFDLESAPPDETGASYVTGNVKIEILNHPVPYEDSQTLRAWAEENIFQDIGLGNYKIIKEGAARIGPYNGLWLVAENPSGAISLYLLVPRGQQILLASSTPQHPEAELVLSSIQAE